MPTYVYKFIETGETIEVQQSFEEDALTEAVHPERGETMAVKKVFLPVGVTFRGDGFYKTDSRAASKTASKTESKSGSTSNGSSESSGGTSGSSESSGSSAAPSSASTSTPGSSSD